MKELTLEEIHQYGLGCLIYFDKICRKHGLRYSLAFGTLIGAIRHKGFIPWDDDIDVVMMRCDYERLVRLFLHNIENDDKYGFINEMNNVQYHYTIGRIIDKRTKICFTSNEENVDDMGVFIDIYPIDYIPQSLLAKKAINYFMMVIVFGLLSANTVRDGNFEETSWWKFIFKKSLASVLCAIGRENIYAAYYAFLKLLPSKSPYVDDLWDRVYLFRPPFLAQWFDELVQYRFEGHNFLCFKEADLFLKNYYGEYMNLPPEEDQIPHHNYKAYLR